MLTRYHSDSQLAKGAYTKTNIFVPANAGITVSLLSAGKAANFSSQLRDDLQPALLARLSPFTGSLTTIKQIYSFSSMLLILFIIHRRNTISKCKFTLLLCCRFYVDGLLSGRYNPSSALTQTVGANL
jgi:hypothetical protein